MRTVAIMQPTYIPWIGYFELMDRADVFIFLDDVQYEKKSWQSRNRIKSDRGELMLSVPVITSSKQFQKICEAVIDNGQPWARKHVRSIKQNYREAKFSRKYLPEIEHFYSLEHSSLSHFNCGMIEFIARAMGIETECKCSSMMRTREGRNERIIDLCRAVGCDTLYDAAGAREVIDADALREAGIETVFQDYEHPTYRQQYEHPTYRQQYGEFLPYMSAIDLLLNEGPQSLEIIRSGVGMVA